MAEASTQAQLKLWTRRGPDGVLWATWLLQDGEALALVEGADVATASGIAAPALPTTFDATEAVPVLPSALFATFTRYGRALEERVTAPPRGPGEVVIELGDRTGGVALLRAFRFRAMVDVEPSDYLVLERPGQEPLCAPANMIAPALAVVSRAAVRAAARGAGSR